MHESHRITDSINRLLISKCKEFWKMSSQTGFNIHPSTKCLSQNNITKYTQKRYKRYFYHKHNTNAQYKRSRTQTKVKSMKFPHKLHVPILKLKKIDASATIYNPCSKVCKVNLEGGNGLLLNEWMGFCNYILWGVSS